MEQALREHIDFYNTDEFQYKQIVIITFLVGIIPFGRLIQIRKKCGAFGTDAILVRLPNGELQTYENVGINHVKEYYLHRYKHEMDKVEDVDDINGEYHIAGTRHAKGFIVEYDEKLSSFNFD